MIPNPYNVPPYYEPRPTYDDDYVHIPIIKPIRLLQFSLLSSLVGLIVYTIIYGSPYTETDKVLLVLVFGSFTFITFIDIISQFGGDPISETPMFLFGIVGAVLLLLAAFQIFSITRKSEIKEIWRLITTIALSVITSVLYLIDVLLIFLYGY